MDERQKKVILRALIILGISISIGLSIAWLVFIVLGFEYKPIEEQLSSLFGLLFSSSGTMTLGLILKYLLNKRHLKEIKKEIKIIEDLKPKKKEEAPKEDIKTWY